VALISRNRPIEAHGTPPRVGRGQGSSSLFPTVGLWSDLTICTVMLGRTRWVAAIAIATGVAIGTSLVWMNLNTPASPACGSTPSGPTPLGTSWAFSSPTEQSLGSYHWYNFTSVSAGGGSSLDNLKFQVQTSNGSIVAPEPGWNLTVDGKYGSRIGSFSMMGPTAGTWSSGGTSPFTTGQTFSFLATPNQLSGDNFAVLGTGNAGGCPFSGSVTVAIP
jgi:hypothetical protein